MTESEESQERALRERLAALREDPAGLDFQATLHRRLVAAGPPDPAPGWDRVRWLFRRGAPWLWPVLGVAAGIAAFLLMSALRQSSLPPAEVAEASRPLAEPGTQVPVSKVAVIKLDFTADVAVEQADFQVSLPEGLSFWADGRELEMRSFAWTQALSAGSNVIPIAVRGQRPGRYRVTAQARTGSQRIEHEVVLEVTDG
ncbi:hypothetical protein [Vitiosangium sp. GDMCC 1.1324]|uniref:hypothetical protein n=1 Tax=Vitiosangium sp. (strain GDMCC 1.1324) TaxID=2138576 RepID=UPI000D36F4B9|nr:hypothetical protein [Vitiosangium sp. GDMCC 1.1324]PTL75705.1 hypothetical protein DAT35_53845 [Vitiosangium sp. GDMCC 1.1324]